ncbi:class I adenylate-forming enzyme family protein [Pseudohaliea rubra]|uniref:Long-chain-fatty-acid--CoA ligase n=1 Tax=Pseudohaliea rubra DSM 19751 TaxID=1265313 RepID=A0A095XYX1_9GAMM|nr:AMP-binding protein [Pseudohaliea rubra]KGE04961.1 Long-chain-fatty-acid--CoA ligase [Pseudohaliea rubra DSM 19751]
MALDDTQVFLPELWASHARFRGASTALVCGDERLSWGELNRRCNQVANALLAAGAGKPSKVAVLMNNAVDTAVVLLGVMKSGACVVPISTMLTATQVATLLADSGASVLFASDATRALADEALADLADGDHRLLLCAGVSPDPWQPLAGWLAGADEGEPPVRYDLGDDFNIIYSSGTTGTPKGIVQTHRARQHWSYSNALELRMDHESVALATTSLYSNGTWFMLLPPLFVGATVVVMESFSPESFLELVAREGVTHTFMVPTQYIGVLESPALPEADLSSLRYMLSAGSPLRQDTKEAVLERLGPGLFELYGFSEGFATICRPEQQHKRGSVGTPVIGFDLRIIDDEGRELPAGEPGEIVGYGGGLMKHYHNREAETEASIWRDERGRTFLRSGDIGKVDRDGFLYILDRKKDMIISGGFNVFPKDIEEVVGAHPDVSDVTVIGIPDPKWGETPLALVIPRAGAAVDPDALLVWANEQLAKAQRLKAVELREDFPRNALGKVIKRELRTPYWEAS